jgi:hypothetical protein
MTATNALFVWFYYGLNGLGGWLIFLLLALIAVVWLLYNSVSRHLPALGWQMGVILTAALILPAILYRFTVDPTNLLASPLTPFSEPIFYLGILGGLLPVVLAVGYFVTYQGMLGCPRGLHGAYDAVLGQCPQCAAMDRPPIQRPVSQPVVGRAEPSGRGYAPPAPKKRKMQAWLVDSNGKSHQLFERETTIGRSAQNDVYLTGDPTISRRQHAVIVEQNGRFRLMHVSTTSTTRVNGRMVREPVLLEPDDEIQFGDRTVLRFVTSGI